MAILHMETQIARDTQKTITNMQQEIQANHQSISNAVANLQPNWMGNSASQFFQEYEQWNSAMSKMIEELANMGTRLQTEISEWEQAAARLE